MLGYFFCYLFILFIFMIPILEVKGIMIMNETGWQVMESDFFF